MQLATVRCPNARAFVVLNGKYQTARFRETHRHHAKERRLVVPFVAPVVKGRPRVGKKVETGRAALTIDDLTSARLKVLESEFVAHFIGASEPADQESAIALKVQQRALGRFRLAEELYTGDDAAIGVVLLTVSQTVRRGLHFDHSALTMALASVDLGVAPW